MIMKTYLMKDMIRGFYKIGKSKQPKFRERTLQAEVPCIKLIHVFEQDMEKELHHQFSDKRLRGEWFQLDSDDVAYILNVFKNAQPKFNVSKNKKIVQSKTNNFCNSHPVLEAMSNPNISMSGFMLLNDIADRGGVYDFFE